MSSEYKGDNYYFGGGRGGAGGKSRNGAGGAGGQGMGASLSLDVQTRNLNLNNNLHVNDRNDNGFETTGQLHSNAVQNPYIQQNIHHHGDEFKGMLYQLTKSLVLKDVTGIDILQRAVAPAAIHGSAESYPQPKCHPETRMKMLQDLRHWALDKNVKQKILWLHGPAGAGKSAIMQTLARQLEDARKLGGSFFFKRGDPTRGNGKALFATIAYQLALSVPDLRTQISRVVEDNPSIVQRAIETQMIKLISEPCRLHKNDGHVTILVDGLDDRPEPHIRDLFESPVYTYIHRSVNVEQSFDDVRKYLLDEFARIHQEHATMTHIPLPWPSPEILQKLVWKSSGYFIYASTIIKFIDDKSYRPTKRLALVLQRNATGSGSAFDALDQLYMTILSSAPRQSGFMLVLWMMAEKDRSRQIPVIEEVLGLEKGETELLLRGLHSVIKLYTRGGALEEIAFHHASFPDFLNDASRSRKFHVDSLQNRIHLARCFLRFAAGRYQTHSSMSSVNRFYSLRELLSAQEPQDTQKIVDRELIPLIISLPPSLELCPPIARINPEYIFNQESGLSRMLSWLHRIPLTPRLGDLIKLWEDCVFMARCRKIGGTAQTGTYSISLVSERIASHEIPQVTVTIVFLGAPFWRIPTLIGRTWAEFRAIICSIHPDIAACEQEPLQVLLRLFPREVYHWAARDLALRLIPIMRNNCLLASQRPADRRDIWIYFPLLVRLSPPCPHLYHELWSISLPQGYWLVIADFVIHHVSKWLKSFPEPKLRIIARWGNGRKPRYAKLYHQFWEDDWRAHIERWNKTITELHLPENLKFPL
ncbi:putative nwd2 protein [Mycena sanguinolenta]|uniref:Putative nwd2 protein n=1 Tax=Mycena sanguinolenta TaxID=230812 RepID=A0A8H6U074_9AGAR|nr:putative nwd2 protein [Mycena sanguinolenta]